MTSWRRPSGLLRIPPVPKTVKLCLECLETRIVPDAASALNFVYTFQGLATHLPPEQIYFLGEQFARNTLNHATPNAEGDQELETDLRILQSVAADTPLVQEAGTLSLEALANPATAAAGVNGLYLTIDAAAFLAGMDAVASADLPQVFANATATANGNAFLAKALPDFQIASQAIAAHVGVMPQELTFAQYTQLFLEPDNLNTPPTAADDAYNVAFNTPLSSPPAANVLSNDTDPRGEPFSVANPGMFTGANGKLFLAADGSFTYTPNADATGTDTFTYQAQDSHGVSNIATITFTIANPPPVAANDIYNVASNTTLKSNGASVLSNDSDPDGEALSVANPGTFTSAKGQLILAADGTFTYAPNARVTGTDTFTYQAQDAHGISNIATITFNITANPPPMAVDHSYTTDFGTSLSSPPAANVLMGASDPHNEPLTVANPSPKGVPGALGTLFLNADGTFTYRPNQGAVGTDTFTYQVKNSDGVLSNQATITITITAPPTAVDHSYAVTFGTSLSSPPATNVLTGASDPDGDTNLTVANPSPNGTPGNHGTLFLNADGTFTYTPVTAGTDTFGYQVKDSNGVLSNQHTLTFTVGNPPPPFDSDLDGDNSTGDPDNDGR